MSHAAPRTDRRAAGLIFALAVLALAPGAFLGLPPSAGKNVGGALRVLAGEWPYRDFWTMYAPGQFFATAGLFALFGRDLVVQALAAVLVRAASAAVLYVVARRLGAGLRAAWLLGALLAASSFELAPELSSYPPALLAILLAFERVLAWLDGRGRRDLATAGVLFGLAACFKHDVAAYAWLATAVGVAAGELRERRPPLAALARLAAGAAAVVLPVAAVLAWRCGADAWRDLFAFPAGDFLAVRAEPYPPYLPRLAPLRAWLAEPGSLAAARDATGSIGNWIRAHAPEAAFLALALRLARRRRDLDGKRLAFAVLALAGLPLFWSAAHVQQNTHFTSMALLVALGACALGLGSARLSRRAWWAGGVLYALGLGVPAAQEAYLAASTLRRAERLDLAGARWTWVSRAEADVYRAIAGFVVERTAPGEPIYCGVARHDAVVVGNQRWHLLCDRPPAVRCTELHPGVSDREDVVRETIADLEAAGVRCAVLWRFGWSDELLDRLLARRVALLADCGSTALDRWLAERFEPAFERGEYVVLLRRAPPPAGAR